MAQRSLDKPKVGGLFQEPRSERVAEDMRVETIGESRLRSPLGKPSLNVPRANPLPSIVKEQGVGGCALAVPPSEVWSKAVQGLLADVPRLVAAALR